MPLIDVRNLITFGYTPHGNRNLLLEDVMKNFELIDYNRYKRKCLLDQILVKNPIEYLSFSVNVDRGCVWVTAVVEDAGHSSKHTIPSHLSADPNEG